MIGNIDNYDVLAGQMNASDKSFQDLSKEFGDLNKGLLADEAQEINKTDLTKFFKSKNPNLSTIDLEFFLKNIEDYDAMTTKLNFNHYYLSLLYIYFDVNTVLGWLKGFNTDRTRGISALISIEFPHSSYNKIFLKGKSLNDLVSATIITKDFSSFFKELDASTKNGAYQYWTETGKNNLGHETLTCYLYNSTKTYKGKILPIEIVLKTPRQFCLEHALKHQLSPKEVIEDQKRKDYGDCLKMYERNNLRQAEMENYIDKLMNGDYILETDWEEFNKYIKK